MVCRALIGKASSGSSDGGRRWLQPHDMRAKVGRPSFDLGQRQRSFGAHAMFSRTRGGSRHLSVTQARRGRSAMHPRKRLSIKSATVAGIAASALLGLAGLTLNPAPAKAVVYCEYVGYPAHCVARAGVVLRPRPVARAAVRHNAGGNLNGGVNRVGVRR